MRQLIVAAVALALAGCALRVPDPVYRRWRDQPTLPAWTPPTLELAATGIEPASATRLKDLAGETGAAYVTALAAKLDDPDALRKALGGAVAPDKGPSDRVSNLYTKAILISVERPSVRPGDRLLATVVTIVPQNFVFSDFVGAETTYATVSVEKVTTNAGVGVSAKLSPTLKADIVGTAELGATSSASRQEAYELTERYDGLSVTPAADKLIVRRKGAVGIDLTGNTLIKIGLRPSGPKADQQSTFVMVARTIALRRKGADLAPDQASLDLYLEKFPPPDPLYACATLAYVDRVVEDGAKFYDESRQKVRLGSGATTAVPFVLVPAVDMVPPLWTVKVAGFPILVETGRGFHEVAFTDPTDASAFLNWARRQKAKQVGSSQVRTAQPIGGGPVSWDAAKVDVLRSAPQPIDVSSLSCAASSP